jgi:glycosyltransferase involved in cell wall biosynthesis
MRILLATDAYPPEVGSGAHLMAELAQELAERGHEVTVLTSWPAYKLDEASAKTVFEEKMMEGRVTVLRVKTLPLHNSGFIVRGFAVLAAPFQYRRVLLRHELRPFDSVLVYSPPLPLAYVGAWEKKRGAKFVLNVQDIFPQNAIDLGILRNPAAIGLFRYIERQAYAAADVITAHSPMNRKLLVDAHPTIAAKAVVLHNWIDASQFEPGEVCEDFRAAWGLEGKFVAVYGGVTGPAQGLEIIPELASRVKDLEDLVFLIVGEGTEKPKLEAAVRDYGLTNVVFRPFVARDRFPSLLAAADVGFLTLSPKMKTPVVPGKILGYMAMGLPVLAIVNRESDAFGIVADAKCGVACRSDDLNAAEAAVREIYANRAGLKSTGLAGQTYARRNFEKSMIVSHIETLMAHDTGRLLEMAG